MVAVAVALRWRQRGGGIGGSMAVWQRLWQLGGSNKSAAVVWRHGSVMAAAVMAARQRWQRQLCGCSGNLAAWPKVFWQVSCPAKKW